ncbi:MAG: hypothetical protein FWE33_03770 [Defluviitaleaceae bacterium]|nr:hypothetical protein [Defluviitaleaceae bacterium]
MVCETKVILALLAKIVGKAETVEEAYQCIVKAASVEGLTLPSYEEYQEELKQYRR